MSFDNQPGFLWHGAMRIPAFLESITSARKRAPGNMEVKSEGSNEFQIYENCSGIPFSYWPSRFRRKACMHGNSLV